MSYKRTEIFYKNDKKRFRYIHEVECANCGKSHEKISSNKSLIEGHVYCSKNCKRKFLYGKNFKSKLSILKASEFASLASTINDCFNDFKLSRFLPEIR